MGPQMPHACLSCATKKRSCDKAFPRCSRCSGSRSNQHCVYRGPLNGQSLSFDNGYIVWPSLAAHRTDSPNFASPFPGGPAKSAFNCDRCRAGKRACSKDLPVCARCKRRKTPCYYGFCNDAVDQDHRSMLAQAWLLQDSIPEANRMNTRSSEDAELWHIRQPVMQREGTLALPVSRLQFKPPYPLPERDGFASLIHYYTEACCFPPLYVLQNSLMAHVHTVWVSRALADPCLFLTLLFAASAHRDMVQGRTHTAKTLYHQAQALKMLRKRVNEGKGISYEMAASAIALTFYSMSGYNTASARIHKSGVLQMLANNQHRGPEFEALTALANLILLGLSVAVDEEPPLIPPVNTSKQISAFVFESDCIPSNLLRRVIARVLDDRTSLLTSDIINDLRNILEFITIAEQASTTDQSTLRNAITMTRTSEWRISDTGHPVSIADKTAQIINKCCHLAIGTFWSLFQSTTPDSGITNPTSSGDAKRPIQAQPEPLEMLRAIFKDLDLVTWKKHGPEAYLWICFTAAAACDGPASRVPFMAVVPPLLTASDTTELSLARDCWRYHKWLTGVVLDGFCM
ncbi:hypothetical protein BJX64DRAFT_271676 [Aspergillus heterothallicus]